MPRKTILSINLSPGKLQPKISYRTRYNIFSRTETIIQQFINGQWFPLRHFSKILVVSVVECQGLNWHIKKTEKLCNRTLTASCPWSLLISSCKDLMVSWVSWIDSLLCSGVVEDTSRSIAICFSRLWISSCFNSNISSLHDETSEILSSS